MLPFIFQYYFKDMFLLLTTKYHRLLVNIFYSSLWNRGVLVGGYLLPQKKLRCNLWQKVMVEVINRSREVGKVNERNSLC